MQLSMKHFYIAAVLSSEVDNIQENPAKREAERAAEKETKKGKCRFR